MSKLQRVTIIRAALTGVAGGAAVALSVAVAPGAGAAPARAGERPVRGLDISAFQHVGTPINWRLLAAQGIRFVAVKATESTYYTNPFYRSDTRAASAAGLAVLSYVFANPPSANGTRTAQFAVRVTGARGRLPLVVDLENDPYKTNRDCYGMRDSAMISWISGFTRAVRRLTGRWPIIYTTAAWWRECTADTRGFPHDPLWLALFGSAPSVPAQWGSWTFWQYSGSGHVPGIGWVDLDYFQPTGVFRWLFPPAKQRKAAHRPARQAKRPVHRAHRRTLTATTRQAAHDESARQAAHDERARQPAHDKTTRRAAHSKAHPTVRQPKTTAVSTAWPGYVAN